MLRTAGLRTRAIAQRPTVLSRSPQTIRHASDTSATSDAAKERPSAKQTRKGPKRKVIGATLAVSLLVGYVYATDTRASIHRYAMVPLIRYLYPDAEDAHHAGVDALRKLYRLGLNPRERGNPDADGALATEVFIRFAANVE